MDTGHNMLKERTKRFALNIMRFVDSLPKSRKTDVIGTQLLRCGASVGANYRAACRAKSQADFIHKMSIVEEEADEAIYGLELLQEEGIANGRVIGPLMSEGNEILSMTVASIRTARSRRN